MHIYIHCDQYSKIYFYFHVTELSCLQLEAAVARYSEIEERNFEKIFKFINSFLNPSLNHDVLSLVKPLVLLQRS